MHKVLFAFLLICMANFAAVAATRCVALDSNTACTNPNIESQYNTIDWNTTCGGIAVRGVGVCTTDSGTRLDKKSTLGTQLNGTHCWCKMVAPFDSLHVYRFGYDTAALCAANCAHGCSTIILRANNADSTSFRTALFTSPAS